jgi:hypothetical protein
VTEKIDLFINDVSGKVHVMSRASMSYAICGTHSQGVHSVHRLGKKTYDFAPGDWCSSCMKVVVMAALKGDKRALVILNYALNRSAKKEETGIDSFRAEISFDDEEMTLKVLAGRSTGARDNFDIKAELELALSWDRLDDIRDLTEETEEVRLTVFSMKPQEV